jgi:hypothetical protein
VADIHPRGSKPCLPLRIKNVNLPAEDKSQSLVHRPTTTRVRSPELPAKHKDFVHRSKGRIKKKRGSVCGHMALQQASTDVISKEVQWREQRDRSMDVVDMGGIGHTSQDVSPRTAVLPPHRRLDSGVKHETRAGGFELRTSDRMLNAEKHNAVYHCTRLVQPCRIPKCA